MIDHDEGLWKRFQEEASKKYFNLGDLTPGKLKEVLKDFFKKKSNSERGVIPYMNLGYLLIVPDEEFIELWKYNSRKIHFYGSRNTLDKVEERAKSLNLI